MPVMDFVLITCAGLFSYGLYRFLGIGQNAVYPFQNVFQTCLAAGLISVSILFFMGAYKRESGLLNVQEIKNTVKGMTISFLLFLSAMVLLKYQIPRYVLVFSYVLSITLLVAEKTALYHIFPLSKNIHGLNKRILIYGAGELGLTLFRTIANSPKLGIFPVGFIDDDPELQGELFRSNGFARSISVASPSLVDSTTRSPAVCTLKVLPPSAPAKYPPSAGITIFSRCRACCICHQAGACWLPPVSIRSPKPGFSSGPYSISFWC